MDKSLKNNGLIELKIARSKEILKELDLRIE